MPVRATEPTKAISVLVVDDDPVTRAKLRALLAGSGYGVSVAADGREAWEMLQSQRIAVVVSDWYMPEVDGPELCRKVRVRSEGPYVYFILITSRGGKQGYLTGMEAGADDFITKPVDPDELKARLTVADRILGLRLELERLEGLLPICAHCKRILDESGQWGSVETHIEQRSEAKFSHGICPHCYIEFVQPQIDRAGTAT
jgi:phosphoserine phosphatase RsbU/P